MKFAYLLKFFLKSVLLISIVLFVILTVLETSVKYQEKVLIAENDLGVGLGAKKVKSVKSEHKNIHFKAKHKTRKPPGLEIDSDMVIVEDEHEIEYANDGESSKNGPYLTSDEMEKLNALFVIPDSNDSNWSDHKMNVKYNLRFWDLVKSGNNTKVTTKPLLKHKLDYLWRPDGEPGPYESNRIVPQIVWQMEALNSTFAPRLKPKKIVLWDSFDWWHKNTWTNPRQLVQSDCEQTPGSLTQCLFTESKDLSDVNAVVVARDVFHTQNVPVADNVLKFHYILESPFHSWAYLPRSLDLLATYWRGSDIVTPYAKWAYYDADKKTKAVDKNYAEGKTKPVAIFVSNCDPWNNRMGYITELRKHVKVDVYGSCGELECSRFGPEDCFGLLKKDYYFYLSFENSNCKSYITEKLFGNALGNDVVPIVMGAHPDDYKAMVPYKSYIHIEEFDSPKELGEYLKYLIENPKKYNSYFEWKGTGEFLSSNFFCQLCAMVHYADFVPPPIRTKPYRWGHVQAIESGMCLPRGEWYWTRGNATFTSKDSKHSTKPDKAVVEGLYGGIR